MMTLLYQTPAQIVALLLVFVRVGAMCFVGPLFGTQRVPVAIRAGLSLLLTVVLQPVIAPTGIEPPTTIWLFATFLVREALVGAILGYGANLIFSVVQMTGELQDTQAGFGFAGVVDPNMSQHSAILGQFQMVLMWVIFLSVNGHHVLLQALADSFSAIPLTAFSPEVSQVGAVFHLATSLMFTAVRIGAPLLAAVLLTDLAMGLLQRTAPQLNLMAVGFQVKMSTAVIMVIIALPFMLSLFRSLVPTIQPICRLLLGVN